MGDRYLLVERGERCRKSGRCVWPWTMSQSGRFCSSHPRSALRTEPVSSVSVLSGNHHAEIDVRRDAEEIEHARAHIGVLAGVADGGMNFWPFARGERDRGELDCFGPGSKYDEQAHLAFAAAGMLSVRPGTGVRINGCGLTAGRRAQCGEFAFCHVIARFRQADRVGWVEFFTRPNKAGGKMLGLAEGLDPTYMPRIRGA